MDVTLRPPQETDTEALPRLSSRLQLLILLAIAGIVIGVVLTASVVENLLGRKATTEQAQAGESGRSYRPTAEQWRDLGLLTVEDKVFADTRDTDGKIAINDDLTTPVFSPYSGLVTKVFAKMGDVVHEGDPLFAIKASEFVQGQNDLISAVATLKTAEAQLCLAQTNERRQHELYVARGAALKDWQQSQVDLATAQGNHDSAMIALAAVRNRLRILGKTDREIREVEDAPNLRQFSPVAIVNAPIGGVITSRQVGLGQNIVSASIGATTPVFSIGDMSKVWLVANAEEVDSSLFHAGDPVVVRVLALPGREFNARITYVAPSIDPNTRRLLVRAEIENPGLVLKPGMFATFSIVVGEDMSAAALPEEAIVHDGSAAHVWVADRGRKLLMMRTIHTGRLSDGMIEVLSGLHAGEEVVTHGSLFIDRAATAD